MQAYRQFFLHVPVVRHLLLPENVMDITNKYESNFVVMPAYEASFIDRIFYSMYR